MHREGMAKGAEVWPQVSCRPLTFSMNLIEPFTLNTSPIFAELMPRHARRAPCRLRRSGVARPRARGLGRTARACRRAGTPTRSWSRPPTRTTSGASCVDIAAEAGEDPFDTLLDLSADETDLKHLRVKAVARQRRRRGRGDAAQRAGLHARPERRRRPRQPAVRRPAAHRPARQLGARPRRAQPGGRGPQAHPGAGRPLRLRRPRRDRRGQGGRPRRVRPGDGRARPAAPGARLPGRRRAAHRRPARRACPTCSSTAPR